MLQGHLDQHRGMQDFARGPQWWAEGPPLIFLAVQNLGIVK